MNESELWMLDDLPIGVWVARAPEGNVVYTNRAFVEIFGRPADEASVLGDLPATYRIRDFAGNPFPVDRLPFSRALATGERVTSDETVIHRPDGRIPLRVVAQPVKNGAGVITHVIVAFIDITDEVKARTERALLETRLMDVVNHAPVVAWSADCDGIITLS